MSVSAVATSNVSAPAVAGPLSVLVMAKAAVPGRVKTRLTRGRGALSPDVAAAVHAAMLDTVLARLRPLVRGGGAAVLALDDPALAPDAAAEQGWTVVPQGAGDLGERIARAWRHVTGPAAVFGVDSPDVPGETLNAIAPSLVRHDPLLGPVTDGGYWTLAARDLPLALLQNIDWGTPAVYDQTHAAARAAGLTLADLPPWHDVDDAADLAALRQRLTSIDPAAEPDLAALADRLNRLLGNAP